MQGLKKEIVVPEGVDYQARLDEANHEYFLYSAEAREDDAFASDMYLGMFDILMGYEGAYREYFYMDDEHLIKTACDAVYFLKEKFEERINQASV